MTTEEPKEGLRQQPSRVRQLYEISKLLTSFGGVEETVTAIVGLMAQTFPLRSPFRPEPLYHRGWLETRRAVMTEMRSRCTLHVAMP